LLTAHQHN